MSSDMAKLKFDRIAIFADLGLVPIDPESEMRKSLKEAKVANDASDYSKAIRITQ